MTVRRVIVEADLSSMNVKEFCATHGVSTWFFYDLRRRYAQLGEVVLEPMSRAPRTVANRTPVAVEEAIVAERKWLADQGLDNGAGSIRDRLVAAQTDGVPSESTIWRLLHDRGLIVAEPKKAPKRSRRRFVAERANECWQIDATHWALADGAAAEIINVIDDCSRVLVASRVVPVCTTAAAVEAICWGAKRWGLPERVLSDNGRAFRGGMTAPGGMEPALHALGITVGHSRPYHPQTCGKVERFHQTLKRWLAARDPAEDPAGLQTQIDDLEDYYNHHRPHRGINRRVPADVWAGTPRSGPASRPLDTPTAVYTRGIVRYGRVTAGRWVITVGAKHNTSTATTVITGIHAHVFIDGRLVRALQLDPTKRTQPLR